MKHALLVMALTGMLCVGLTSCSIRTSENMPDSGAGATAGQAAENDMADANGTGQVGDLNQDEIGNGDPAVDSNAETQARRSALRGRTAYDYLNDGKYQAGKDGMIRDRSSLSQDLTQGARDLIRDAKELGRDMAGDVGAAARSAGQAARDTGSAARDTIREKMS